MATELVCPLSITTQVFRVRRNAQLLHALLAQTLEIHAHLPIRAGLAVHAPRIPGMRLANESSVHNCGGNILSSILDIRQLTNIKQVRNFCLGNLGAARGVGRASERFCSARLPTGIADPSTCPREGGRYTNQNRIRTQGLAVALPNQSFHATRICFPTRRVGSAPGLGRNICGRPLNTSAVNKLPCWSVENSCTPHNSPGWGPKVPHE